MHAFLHADSVDWISLLSFRRESFDYCWPSMAVRTCLVVCRLATSLTIVARPAPRAQDDDHAWAVRAAVPHDEVSELLLQRQEVRHGAADVGVFDVGGIFRRRRTPNDYKACTRRRPPRAPRPRRPEPAGRCHRQGSDRGPRLAIKAAPVGYGAIFQHIGCRRLY